MKKIPMILLAMFTLSGCDRQEMIYSFNHVEEASVDNEVENTESVDNIQAETEPVSYTHLTLPTKRIV